jgi:hypothetical protein
VATVPNAPGMGWNQWLDPLRRRDQFADIFATASVRPEVEALVQPLLRGLVDLRWIRELFADRANALVEPVRSLDRDGLRDAYALLFLEDRLVVAALRTAVVEVVGADLGVHVQDAVGELLNTLTGVERLGRAWTWFLNGDQDSDQ